MLLHAALLAYNRVSIEKNFQISVGKNLAPNVAALHHDTAAGTHLPLARNHPGTHRGMHGNPRCRFRHIAFANTRGNIPPVEQRTVAADCGLELNARALSQLYQRRLFVE